MASAVRKMAVYLGLVEDDHRYEDHYQDEFSDAYDEYGADLVQEDDRPDSAAGAAARRGRQRPARGSAGPTARYIPLIWRVSPQCIRGHTMKRGRSESTSVRALR